MGIHPGSRGGGDDGRYSQNGRSRNGEIPRLEMYPDEPLYDLATVVHLVGVRAMTLWAWEQQLGVPFAPAGRGQRMTSPLSEDTANSRRYSERDLIALIWLRERIVDGAPPHEAAARLISAQQSGPMSGRLRPNPPGGSTTGPLGRQRIHTGPLHENGYTPPAAPSQYSGRVAPETIRLGDLHGDVEAVLAADAQATIAPERPELGVPARWWLSLIHI